MVSSAYVEVITSKVYGHHHDLGNRTEISVTNDHDYVPFAVITIRSFPVS
jgi:hypothetical protein